MADLTQFTRHDNYPNSIGAKRESVGRVHGPASYTTGGNAADAASVGLKYIEHVSLGCDTTGTYEGIWVPHSGYPDTNGGKMYVRVLATGVEVAARVDLSSYVFVFRAVGM